MQQEIWKTEDSNYNNGKHEEKKHKKSKNVCFCHFVNKNLEAVLKLIQKLFFLNLIKTEKGSEYWLFAFGFTDFARIG